MRGQMNSTYTSQRSTMIQKTNQKYTEISSQSQNDYDQVHKTLPMLEKV